MNKIVALLLFVLAAFTGGLASAQTAVPQSREQIALSFAPLVKQVSPSVVNIYTTRVIEQRLSPLFADPFFRQFFGDNLPPGFSRERMESSLGSGVIVGADGLIVTSNHVINGADQIRVVLSDRREFDAKLITADVASDLAVLRVDTKGEKLLFLELKDSDDAQIGDLVLAIGNPFGVGRTVTSGIISAFAHTSLGVNDLDYFIQTDAAINPGNSGGALVTMDGRLVGINAAIYSRDGGSLGIGFAVPSNMVRVVLNAVAEGRKSIVRPWLGIEGQEITSELAASMNMPQPSGYLVNSLHPISPVAKDGLKAGDVILAINGRLIEGPESFRYRIATMPVGSPIEIGVLRKGKELVIKSSSIAPPEDPPRETTEVTGRNPLGGATIANVSPAVNEEMGLRGIDSGVVVMGVKGDSVAVNVGVRPGDIVLSINGAKTASVRDVTDAVKQEVKGWRVEVQRGGNVLAIMVGG